MSLDAPGNLSPFRSPLSKSIRNPWIDHVTGLTGVRAIAEEIPMGTVNFSLTDEVALVTGAASGIGQAIAEAIAASGAAVGLVDVTEQGSQNTANAISDAGGRALPVAADVTDLDQLRAAVERIEAAYG